MDNQLVLTFGLDKKQIEFVRSCTPTKQYQVEDVTGHPTDLVAVYAETIIINDAAIDEYAQELLTSYCKEYSGQMILWFGLPGPARQLRKSIRYYDSFDALAAKLKYHLLAAYSQSRNVELFSKKMSYGIQILSLIRKHPGISTKELAERTELSIRAVQRYITALQAAGEWIDYDTKQRGWRLQTGFSVLFDDFDREDYPRHKQEGTVKNNLFDFATSELSQDAFLCWCLNWYNSSQPMALLYPMAKELLTLLGEPDLAPDQKLTIWHQFHKIDVLVVLQSQDRAIIIEDKTSTSEHDNQIAQYRRVLQNLSGDERETLGISNEVKIRTVFFKTGFHYDYDRATVADCKVDGPAFLSVLEKYEHLSEILDDYIHHLRWSIEWYAVYGKYDEPGSDNFWSWNISRHHIAQHNFMRDMLRERFPESMWSAGTTLFHIRNGANVGGRPWTQLSIVENAYPGSKDKYTLFWRVDTDGEGPYISLRYYERFDKKDKMKFDRHSETYDALRQKAQRFLSSHPELKLRWDDVKGGYTGGYYESTILTICLREPLLNWNFSRNIVKQQVLAITEHFIEIETSGGTDGTD